MRGKNKREKEKKLIKYEKIFIFDMRLLFLDTAKQQNETIFMDEVSKIL